VPVRSTGRGSFGPCKPLHGARGFGLVRALLLEDGDSGLEKRGGLRSPAAACEQRAERALGNSRPPMRLPEGFASRLDALSQERLSFVEALQIEQQLSDDKKH
jgi:hypothetical protein